MYFAIMLIAGQEKLFKVELIVCVGTEYFDAVIASHHHALGLAG